MRMRVVEDFNQSWPTHQSLEDFMVSTEKENGTETLVQLFAAFQWWWRRFWWWWAFKGVVTSFKWCDGFLPEACINYKRENKEYTTISCWPFWFIIYHSLLDILIFATKFPPDLEDYSKLRMSSSLSPDEIKEQNDTDSFIVQMHIVGHVDTCKKNFPPGIEYYKISSNKTTLNPVRMHIVGHVVACKKTSHLI